MHDASTMIDRITQRTATFGGQWTEEKLAILERYLDAYTTALKNQRFKLLYIDAFAGAGQVELSTEDQSDIRRFVSGSAERAINIGDKPFDELIFVEQDPDRCAELENLKATHNGRNIAIENCDANAFLSNLDKDWRGWRGVLFLDPFATQVKWSTLEKIEAFKSLDTWVLFPISALLRMLPQSRRPDEIDHKWVSRLAAVFGDEGWRNLYRERRQQDLFGPEAHEREAGIDGLLGVYKGKLSALFGNRFLQSSRTLRNSKNSPLFELLFCAGNPRGATLAKRIANHILEDL